MDTYKKITVDLAVRAGTIMRENFTGSMRKEWKSDGTPLTVSDTAINDMVVATIAQEFPSHAVLGEEGSYNLTTNSEYTWSSTQ